MAAAADAAQRQQQQPGKHPGKSKKQTTSTKRAKKAFVTDPAVTIPHDGPIHRLLLLESRSHESSDAAGTVQVDAADSTSWAGSPSEIAALRLLLQAGCHDDESTGSLDEASRRLLDDLRDATDVQNQLAALRSYRSTVLHILAREEAGDAGGEDEPKDAEGVMLAANATNASSSLIGTYRILVELSLSPETPVAVARAVRSSLDAVRGSIDATAVNEMHREVAQSITVASSWADPIFTMFQALSYDPPTCLHIMGCSSSIPSALEVLLKVSLDIEGTVTSKSFNASSHVAAESGSGDTGSGSGPSALEVSQAIDRGTEVACTLKLVMAQLLINAEGASANNLSDVVPTLDSILESLLLPLLACTSTSTDSLSKIGVVLGQVWLYKWFSDVSDTVDDKARDQNLAQLAAKMLHQFTGATRKDEWMTGLPDLNTLSAVRGIAATLPDSILLQCVNDTVLLRSIGSYLLRLCNHSTDPAVRLSAIRGLDTVLTRVASILRSESSENSLVLDADLECFVKDCLSVALSTWSNSSSRQVSSAVPGLFKSVISVMRTSTSESMSIDAVILRVLEQPTNRKGRYIALEALLKDKAVGAKLFDLGGGSALIQSFIEGISDSESVARPIADLMGKLLCSVREEMNAKAGIGVDLSNPAGSKKDRRKREKQLARDREQGHVEAIVAQPQILPSWIELWADPVARAMLSPVHRRRTRVADFCLPMLETMSGGPTRRIEMSHCFGSILEKLNSYSGPGVDADRVLWAKLEVVRQARNQKMTKMSVLTAVLQRAIAEAVPRSMLQSALTHNDSTIHLAAFSTLDALLPSYTDKSEPETALDLISQELDLWTGALPYVCKCNGKEHVSQMIKCLDNILIRASNVQAETREINQSDETKNDVVEEEGPDIVVAFCDFLTGDMFVKNGSYPGTVADKEAFALPLASCILSFACNGKILSKSIAAAVQLASDKPKKRSKNKGVTNRKLTPEQLASREKVLRRLVSTEVFGSILSLLHSMWDKTRALAYEFICDLINQALLASISLPPVLMMSEGQRSWQTRAFHLAASPRQREADTGGRMLSVLYAASSPLERKKFLANIATLSSDRIDTMAAALSDASSGRQPLPLAYGLLQALRLMLEQNRALVERDSALAANADEWTGSDSVDAYMNVATVASRAIQTSLAIVADIKKDNEDEDEDKDDAGDEDMGDETPAASEGPIEDAATDSAMPLNVNTGAIGANAVYSSIKASGDEAEKERYALQRVIVGSWLLMKEACATLCTAIVEYPLSPPPQLVEDAGSLLITAMVSLKHQGAAFAAHNALQQIALACNSYEHLFSFPDQWASRILYEISSQETVRDSTLRRSTGYALGLLSLMRTQPSFASSSSAGLCQNVLAQIVRFSLPSATAMGESLAKWAGNVSAHVEDVFIFPSLGPNHLSFPDMFVSDDSYEIRTRVHALNILRLAILDAPLAPVTNKIIGDAFISAIIGYSDPSWRVRSSATMVFAAAMLRVDANKNASALPMDKKEESKTTGTAITAVELFRCYPPLSYFLLTSLEAGIGASGASSEKKLEDVMFDADASAAAMDSDHLHPALFPVLLLLSRLQPVSQTPSDADATQHTDPFVDLALLCLQHKHHKVRVMASRAISVLCSGDNTGSISSRENLIQRCSGLLAQSIASDPVPESFNAQHGLLLGIQALLHSSTQPKALCQDEKLSQIISYFATWANGSGACPPLSTKVALEILDHCETARRTNAEDETSSEAYLHTVYSAVAMMESVTCNANSAVVGGAQLGMAAGKLACEASFDFAFSFTHDKATRIKHVGKVEALLTSDCYDIRIHAAKAFKKRIWSKVDEILADTSVERHERAELIAPVCAMLMNALRSEMSRKDDVDGLGAHPPNLRRMSRCAIECLTAHRSLIGHQHLPLGNTSVEDLWNMLMDMRELGRETSDTSVDAEEAGAGTSLAGNAVELFALVISLDMVLSNKGDEAFNEKASFFVGALSLSTDPDLHWVVRHSAAVAVGSSGILTDSFSGSDPVRKQLRLKAYLSVLTFLQDSDADVRDAAGRSLSSSLDNSARSKPRIDGHISSHVPLMELEMAYHQIGERHHKDNGLANYLAATILRECRDSRPKLDLALSEFDYSEHCQEASKLLNQNTTRKIFEAEDSNPYSESLTTCQLSASLLAQCSLQGEDHKEVEAVMNEITSECGGAILKMIRARASTNSSFAMDMTHNLTWSNDAFPLIHNSLLGSIVTVYLGFGIGSTVVADARDLLQVLGSQGQELIHPCIREALTVLSEASAKDANTKSGLLRACFLSPSVCRT